MSTREWGRIRAQANEPVAEVHIYDEIGYWGTTAASFAREISALDVEEMQVFLNSPGGDAWDGLAIMNALMRHPAKVTVTVDGLAASAASVIAMAGDVIKMNIGAEMMIHDAWTFAAGSATELEKTAEALHKLSNSYADAYAARAGGTREEWRELMLAETWFSAEEAVEAGLATEWVDAKPVEAAATARASFDLSRFRFQGRAAAPGPRALGVTNGSAQSEPSPYMEGGSSVTYEELREALVERLGVDGAEVTDEELLEALDEALADDEGDDDGDGGEPGASASVAPVLPEGVEMIDSAVLAALREAAESGQAAAEAAAVARREGLVQAAVAAGRIAPASRGAWLDQLAKDEEGASALLASLAPNTIPVAEVGLADAEASSEDALYNKLYNEGEGA